LKPVANKLDFFRSFNQRQGKTGKKPQYLGIFCVKPPNCCIAVYTFGLPSQISRVELHMLC